MSPLPKDFPQYPLAWANIEPFTGQHKTDDNTQNTVNQIIEPCYFRDGWDASQAPLHVFPHIWQQFIRENCIDYPSPDNPHYYTACLTAIGGFTCGNSREFWHRKSLHKACLFISMVGNSSSGKGGVQRACIKPLEAVDSGHVRQQYEKKKENAPKGEKHLVKVPSVYTSNTTLAGIFSGLSSNRLGFGLSYEEMDKLLKVGQYTADSQDLCSLYDGLAITVMRATGEKTHKIPSTNMVIIGGTTDPQRFMDNGNDTNGLTNRFIFVAPKSPSQEFIPSTPTPKAVTITKSELDYREHVKGLYIANYDRTENGEILDIRLSLQALSLETKYLNTIRLKRHRAQEANNHIEASRLGKAKDRFYRYMLILHSIWYPQDTEIQCDTVERAWDLHLYYENQYRLLFGENSTEDRKLSKLTPKERAIYDLAKSMTIKGTTEEGTQTEVHGFDFNGLLQRVLQEKVASKKSFYRWKKKVAVHHSYSNPNGLGLVEYDRELKCNICTV